MKSMNVFDKVEHKYYRDGYRVPAASDLMRAAGFQGAYQFMDQIHSLRGGCVHEGCAAIDQGLVPRVTLSAARAEDQRYIQVASDIENGYWPAFVRLKKMTGFQGFCYECSMIHPRLRFGGTFDAFGEANGILVLGDLKSGMMPHSVAVQLALYWILITEGEPVNPEHPGFDLVREAVQSGRTVERWGMQLEKTGVPTLFDNTKKGESLSDRKWLAIANSIINVWHFRNDYGLLGGANA